MEQLQALPGVRVIAKTPELKWRQDHSRIWNETWLSAFFHKPCNHDLFVQQSLNMEGALLGFRVVQTTSCIAGIAQQPLRPPSPAGGDLLPCVPRVAWHRVYATGCSSYSYTANPPPHRSRRHRTAMLAIQPLWILY